jgi:hypothetical protein
MQPGRRALRAESALRSAEIETDGGGRHGHGASIRMDEIVNGDRRPDKAALII